MLFRFMRNKFLIPSLETCGINFGWYVYQTTQILEGIGNSRQQLQLRFVRFRIMR